MTIKKNKKKVLTYLCENYATENREYRRWAEKF